MFELFYFHNFTNLDFELWEWNIPGIPARQNLELQSIKAHLNPEFVKKIEKIIDICIYI